MSHYDPTWLCLLFAIIAAVLTLPPVRSSIAQAIGEASLERELCRDLHNPAPAPTRLQCDVGVDSLLKEEVAVWGLD